MTEAMSMYFFESEIVVSLELEHPTADKGGNLLAASNINNTNY